MATPLDEGLDRHHRGGPRARLPSADRAAPRARARGRADLARVRADARAAPAARARRDRARPPRGSGPRAQGPRHARAAARAPPVGATTRLRPRAGAWLARADADGSAPRYPQRDDVRLRVGALPAHARLPRGDQGRRSRRDPRGTAAPVRGGPGEAPPLPGAEGGVLPRGLRAGPERAGGARRRPDPHRRRLAPAARRVLVPPPCEPALSADARAPRAPRGRSRGRDPAHAGAARPGP